MPGANGPKNDGPRWAAFEVPRRRAAQWWVDEAEELTPRRKATLAWVLAHPEAVVVPATTLVMAAFAVAYGGGDDAAFRHAGEAMVGPRILDTFGNAWLQIGPFYLVAVGLLGRLVEPWAGGRATDILLASLQGALVVWLAMGTTGRLARFNGRPTVLARWAVGSTLAVGGAVALSLEWGHPEELLLGLLLVEVGLLVGRGRHAWAGALLGVSVGVKAWGAIGVGALLGARRYRGVLVAGATAALVVAAAYLPFVLFGAFRTTEHVWGFGTSTALGWVAARTGMSEWALRAGEGVLVGAVGAAVARRRWSSPAVLALLVITLRLLLDPAPRPYFVCPAIAVALVWVWTSGSRGARRWRAPITILSPLPVQLRAALPPDQTWHVALALVTLVGVYALVAEASETRRRRPHLAATPGTPSAATTLTR